MLVSGSNSKGTPLSIVVVSIEQPATSAHSSGNNDVFDQHNKPRLRRELILSALQKEYPELVSIKSLSPRKDVDLIDLYRRVHDVNMIEFILNAWTKWAAMGRDGGWYEECCHPEWLKNKEDCKDEAEVPPMVPCHVSFRRDGIERPSDNVMGALGYYCTDLMTPIVGTLVEELMGDAQIIEAAVDFAFQKMEPGDANESPVESGAFPVVYAVTTHPGHHANRDNFGGYCYLNNAALCAKLMQERLKSLIDISTDSEPPNKKRKCRVAILDIDYHCGNGTGSIFYRDPGIFFSSIHCDPGVEYPFNAGYADQIGAEGGIGATHHIPLAPGATWETYKIAIEKAMNAILAYDVCGLVVSLGLDTYEGDSVAVNRGGFKLSGLDYLEIGKCMGKFMKGKNIPIVFVQEGGYKMDVVGEAAAHVVGGFAVGAGGD
mmetsp:Transcript_7451/g.16012  ORF Transcript_7451/g.16012 Transcript_7451/m.16012 type:complete len:432 (+) Transcript_7451:175-1470(+)